MFFEETRGLVFVFGSGSFGLGVWGRLGSDWIGPAILLGRLRCRLCLEGLFLFDRFG